MEKMGSLDYCIVEETAPFVAEAIEFLDLSSDVPTGSKTGVLDVGSSYGIGAAVMKYGLEFQSVWDFFRGASQDRSECVNQTRHWLAQHPPVQDIHYPGLDSSRPAIEFGVEAGLLDDGIAKDLESPGNELDARERALVENCDLLVSTGAVGYLGKRTFEAIVPHLGKSAGERETSPLVLFSVLDIFDAEDITAVLSEHGFECRRLPGVSLTQRNFFDDREREALLSVLGPGTPEHATWLERRKLCAGLFVAAPVAGFERFHAHMTAASARITGQPAVE